MTVRRTAIIQVPLARAGVAADDDAELYGVAAPYADPGMATVFDGARVSRIVGGAGDPWLRIELYREVP